MGTPNPRGVIGVNNASRRGRTDMADDFALNSLLSTFVNDCHDISSEFDVSGLSQKEVETQINRLLPQFVEARTWR